VYRSKTCRVLSDLRIRGVAHAALEYSLITSPKSFPALHRCAWRHDDRRVVVGRSFLAGLVRAVAVVVAGMPVA
jgi:hypothetical protein